MFLTVLLPFRRQTYEVNSQTLKHQVLIADDDRAIREALVRALSLEGYAVTAVNDGAKVLKIFPAWQSSPRVIGDVAPLIGPIKFMPTGGLNPESIKEWIKAGANRGRITGP